MRDTSYILTLHGIRGMPPTNNHAEQFLRLPVIFRKIVFGSQSEWGAQALVAKLSLR